MLNLMLVPEGVDQAMYHGESERKLVTGILRGATMEVSVHCTGMWTIWLYRRDNPAGRNEAGVVYEVGPKFNEKEGPFPGEILRFFSDDEECYKRAFECYYELVQEHQLKRMGTIR